MDAAVVARLATAEGRAALAVAAEQPDLTSPASLSAVRRRVPDPGLASAACAQENLRRRARAKFGDEADGLLLTADGLEQASRPEVAEHRAARLAATGVRTVVDLGCGIGSDARALARAGLHVVAVERDPATAAVARANLAGLDAEVREGDAEALAGELLDGPSGVGVAAFCDPARRDARGRLFDVTQFTPGWELVRWLLAREAPGAVKLGPAVPHAQLPGECEAEWVTHRGATVEACLWGGKGARAGHRLATVLPGPHELLVPPGGRGTRAPVGPVGAWVHEPVGSVVRAGGIAGLAERLDLHLVDPDVAYLSGDSPLDSPFVDSFRVVEVLPWREKDVRAWLRRHDVGRLEIKKRGLELDPAQLRRRLKPSGAAEITLLLTRTPEGARAVLAHRDR